MARRRLAVALLVPQPLATEVNGIRRACGDPRLGRIVPHITLVPPINVAEERMADVLDLCRQVAASTPLLRLTLGAPSTFAPQTPLAWLTVGGDVSALADLRRALDSGVLARPPEHDFVAHVTISGKVANGRLEAIVASLIDFEAACTVDRLHVLDNRQLPHGRWGWVPVADAELGPPAVIGRGGLALELSTGTVLDPDAEALFGSAVARGHGPVVVIARRDGAVVGVAAGVARDGLAVLHGLVVGEGHRRQGVGSHLLARFTAEAATAGSRTLFYVAERSDAVAGLCRQRGWTDVGSGADDAVTLVRLLA